MVLGRRRILPGRNGTKLPFGTISSGQSYAAGMHWQRFRPYDNIGVRAEVPYQRYAFRKAARATTVKKFETS